MRRENGELRRRLGDASGAPGDGARHAPAGGESALREGNALLRALFDGALDAILLIDDDQRYVDVNPSACALFGISRQDLIGQRADQLVVATPPGVTWRELFEVGTLRGSFTMRRPDGEIREIEFASTARILPGLHLSVMRDVTEHKQAQRALAANEARFRALLDNSAEAVALRAADGTLQYVSAPVERLLGWSPAELLAKDAFAWVDEHDRPRAADAMAALIAEPSRTVETELRAHHRDGSIRWLRSTATNLLDNLAVGAIVENLRDVTESRDAAEALRESERRYREVVEHMPEPVLVHVDGRIAFANAATAHVLGVARADDLRGRSIVELAHPDSRAVIEARLASVERGVPAALSEQRYVRQDDGEEVTIEVASIPLVRDGRTAVLSVGRDVTARKAAERQAAEAFAAATLERKKLEQILDALPVGVWIANAAGAVVQTNPAAMDVWRRTPPVLFKPSQYQEYKGYSAATGEPLKPEDWPLARTVRTGETIPAEVIDIDRFDGTRAQMLHIAAPINDPDGARIGGVAVALDVTEERRLARERERLIASLDFERTRLGTLLQKAPSFIVVTHGEDHVIGMANDAFHRLVGKRDLVGKAFRTALPELEPQGVAAFLDGVYATGSPFVSQGLQLFTSRAAGEAPEARFVNVMCMPLDEASGERTGVFVHGVDVTEETAARERIRAQFNGIPSPTYAWKALGDGATPDLVFIDCNDAARAVSRDGVASLIGKHATDVYADDLEVLADLRRCLAEKKTFQREMEYRPRTGGETARLNVTYSFAPPDIVIAHAENITERRSLEEQLRQAQKMEAVGRLAGGIAHDFNNLLTVILSYCTFLSERLQPSDPMRDDVDQMRKAGQRAVELTKQLLAFSRQQVLEPQIIDMNDILGGLEKMLRRVLGEDIELAFRKAAALRKIFADPGRMEQVIMNLVVNARDAMPDGGKLTIETADVDLDEAFTVEHHGTHAGEFVKLTVSDTGIGMDSRTRARMFEPFFTTKAVGKGTGLGLSTVFGIVHQSDGHVWVDSEPGKGTVFQIFLPVAPRGSSPQVLFPLQEHPAGGTETILLVEDEDAVRAVVRTILARAGYVVLETEDGKEALLLCERESRHIDLLLTDVVMPHMSGRVLSERLRAARPDLRVLFMSGYTDDAAVHGGAAGTGVALLQKPITPDMLLAKVRDVLDRAPPEAV